MSQRGQTRANGPTTQSESADGGELQPGWGDQARGAVVPSHSRAGRRISELSTSSSGYHSLDYDSLPSSPLMTDNKSTQTPSPSSQVIAHAQERISRAPPDDEIPQASNRFRPRSLSMPADMRPEAVVAQELRRIGDELNNLYIGRAWGWNGRAAAQEVPNEPIFMLWVAALVERLLWILRGR